MIKIVNMRSLRRSQTPAENILWQALRRKQVFGYKFRRQHAIGQFILDFYCSPLRLGIEVDGNIHNVKEILSYDKAREELLRNFGVTMIRIQNNEIFDDVHFVITKIKHMILQLPSPPRAEEGWGGGMKRRMDREGGCRRRPVEVEGGIK